VNNYHKSFMGNVNIKIAIECLNFYRNFLNSLLKEGSLNILSRPKNLFGFI